jgi:hypothetical protein
MTDTSPEAVVRTFFDIFNHETPDRFDEVIAADYLDYGHDPAGVGPDGARADYHGALEKAGHIEYTIDGLVASDERVAVVWTGELLDRQTMQGLSLYRVVDGKITETRHTLLGTMPAA